MHNNKFSAMRDSSLRDKSLFCVKKEVFMATIIWVVTKSPGLRRLAIIYHEYKIIKCSNTPFVFPNSRILRALFLLRENPWRRTQQK